MQILDRDLRTHSRFYDLLDQWETTRHRVYTCLFEYDNKSSHFKISHIHSHPVLFFHIKCGLWLTSLSLALTSNFSHCSKIFTISALPLSAALCNAVLPSYETMLHVRTHIRCNKKETIINKKNWSQNDIWFVVDCSISRRKVRSSKLNMQSRRTGEQWKDYRQHTSKNDSDKNGENCCWDIKRWSERPL
jgi:hypothetical protein